MMNRMKMTAALACALLTTGVTFAQLPAEVTTKFNEAAELINQKKFIEAIPILETVLTEGETADPESDIVAQAQKLLPECYIRQGAMAAGAGKFEDAITALNKADELADKYSVTASKSKIDNLFPKVYVAYGAPLSTTKITQKPSTYSPGLTQIPERHQNGHVAGSKLLRIGGPPKGEEIYKNIIALEAKHDKYAEAASQAKAALANYLLVDASKAAEAQDLDAVVKATDAILNSIRPTALPT